MSKQIVVWIPGQPSRTTHQSGTRYGKRGTYKTSSLIGWEHTLMRGLRPYAPEEPIDGPIQLSVTFGYKAKTMADRYKWKITRPDTDNSIKTLKDIMTRLGFWHDDAQIVFEICKKIWVKDPGIVIKVEPLADTCEDEEREEK